MRVFSAVVFCVFLAGSFTAFAQTPAPAAAGTTPAAAAARARLDPNSPVQAGRTALYKYLDDIAAKDEAARRAEIAKITTRDQALIRQQQVRFKLLGLMVGGFERTPLNAKVLGSTQMDGFRIEKVVFESQPQFYVTALLYLPDGVDRSTLTVDRSGTATVDTTKNGQRRTDNVPRKLPAIVIAPGHGATGKASDFVFASTFARNGFAVLSYDPIGQGERLQYPDAAHPGKTLATGPTGEHGEAGLQPTLIGDAVARYFVWDGMRAVDYLLTRPEIDGERIGAFGCSGGGVMTAMLGAADKRIKAIATACYLTTMDALLPSIGPQDAEQSTPGFIAAGFDFADWVELAAPRPYAMVGTVGDMFPWAGFLKTAQEARRFYALFDAKAAGVGSSQLSVVSSQLPTPTGPTLNPDTANTVSADAPLQVIAGIGGHGNLKPLTSQIVGFFLVNLAHSDAAPVVAAGGERPQGLKPGDSASGIGTAEAVPLTKADGIASGSLRTGAEGVPLTKADGIASGSLKTGAEVVPLTKADGIASTSLKTGAEAVPLTKADGIASTSLKTGAEAVPLTNTVPPAGALQVTPTGEVATSYPDAVTVHTLNLRRAAGKIPVPVSPQTLLQVQTDIREVTNAEAAPGAPSPASTPIAPEDPDHILHRLRIATAPGITIDAEFYRPTTEGKHPCLLILRDSLDAALEPQRAAEMERLRALAKAGTAVFVAAPRPSPPGGEETKSPILGPFYMTELRAELVGKTLLGMRVDDVIRAIDFFSTGYTEDPNNITAEASGHMGLVLLHAAVLDPRLKHITVDHVLESYDSLLKAPMPLDAPQDILPGVLLKYDIPDLVRVLGPRLTATDWLPGTANLAQR